MQWFAAFFVLGHGPYNNFWGGFRTFPKTSLELNKQLDLCLIFIIKAQVEIEGPEVTEYFFLI